MPAASVRGRVEALLAADGAPFQLLEHAPVESSEHAARLRGLPLAAGGKALVVKVGETPDFRVLALSAARRGDSRLLRRAFGVSRLRFATTEELLALTGLTPGCIPPFGRPVFDLPLYVDEGLAAGSRVAFTPGDHAASIVLATADYLRIARPEAILPFTSER